MLMCGLTPVCAQTQELPARQQQWKAQAAAGALDPEAPCPPLLLTVRAVTAPLYYMSGSPGRGHACPLPGFARLQHYKSSGSFQQSLFFNAVTACFPGLVLSPGGQEMDMACSSCSAEGSLPLVPTGNMCVEGRDAANIKRVML